MSHIDFVLSYPRHMDFLWFRYNFHWIRRYAKHVYMAITPGEPSIMNFIQGCPEYEDVVWVRPPVSDGTTDWRNLAVRDMVINFAKSDYILFLEQDFLMNEEFLRQVTDLTEIEFAYDWIYYQEGERIHPAFSLVKRVHALKTSLNFSVQPDRADHFSIFHDELSKMPLFKAELRELRFRDYYEFHHMAGFTQNYHVYKHGEQFYRPEQFLAYNYFSLNLPLIKEPEFDTMCQQMRTRFGTGDTEGAIKRFFPAPFERDRMNPASHRVNELIKKKNGLPVHDPGV